MMNNDIFQRVLCLIIGYCFGNIIFGYLIGKAKGVDIRTKGSGNVGSTNTLRTLGTKWGFLTLFLDASKCAMAAFVAWLIFRNFEEYTSVLMAYAAFGAILGHDFPVVLNFKGGKGVACTLGFIIAIFPYCVPISLGIFVIVVAISRYVSLGSIIAAFTVSLQVLIYMNRGMFNLPAKYEGTEQTEVLVISVLLFLLILVLHRANIQRLINHNENKFSFKKSSK